MGGEIRKFVDSYHKPLEAENKKSIADYGV